MCSQQISSANLEGVVISPSMSSTTTALDGTLFVHKGYWKGAAIRFVLTLTPDQEGAHTAAIRVLSKDLYHPLISDTDGSVAQLHSSLVSVSQLLPLVSNLHRLFYSPLLQVIGSSDQILNKEAGEMLQNDARGFALKIKEKIEFLVLPAPISTFAVHAVENWTSEQQALLERLLASDHAQTKATQDQVRFDNSERTSLQTCT